MADSWTFAVARDDLGQTTLVDGSTPAVADGEALLRVDRVGLTANNVTYAVLGDAMRYWEFFPPAARGLGPQWGLPPLWGFAEVVASAVAGVEVGQRVYGYLPPAGHLRGAAGPGGRVRVPRREPAPGRAAVAVQRVPVDHRRPGVPGRPGGSADPVPAAVLHLVHAGRPGRRQRLLRCRGAAGVVGVEQDRVRRRVRAARARAAPGRSHLTRQPRLHPVARLLRRGRLVRRHRRPRRGPDGLPRPVRRALDPRRRCASISATGSSGTSRSGSPTRRRTPTPPRRCSSRRCRCASAATTGAATGSTSGSPRPGNASPQW